MAVAVVVPFAAFPMPVTQVEVDARRIGEKVSQQFRHVVHQYVVVLDVDERKGHLPGAEEAAVADLVGRRVDDTRLGAGQIQRHGRVVPPDQNLANGVDRGELRDDTL